MQNKYRDAFLSYQKTHIPYILYIVINMHQIFFFFIYIRTTNIHLIAIEYMFFKKILKCIITFLLLLYILHIIY